MPSCTSIHSHTATLKKTFLELKYLTTEKSKTNLLVHWWCFCFGFFFFETQTMANLTFGSVQHTKHKMTPQVTWLLQREWMDGSKKLLQCIGIYTYNHNLKKMH